MSVKHSILGPNLGQAGWEAAHTIEDATITAAMLHDAYDASGAAATAQAAAIAAAATDATTKANAAAAASQPLDSDLTAIAALSTTSFGRGLLTSADASALRTSAGLGTLATQSGTFSGTSSGTNTGDQTLAGLGGLTQAQTFARMLGS